MGGGGYTENHGGRHREAQRNNEVVSELYEFSRIEENCYAVLWVTQRNTEEEAQRATEKKWGSLRIR